MQGSTPSSPETCALAPITVTPPACTDLDTMRKDLACAQNLCDQVRTTSTAGRDAEPLNIAEQLAAELFPSEMPGSAPEAESHAIPQVETQSSATMSTPTWAPAAVACGVAHRPISKRSQPIRWATPPWYAPPVFMGYPALPLGWHVGQAV